MNVSDISMMQWENLKAAGDISRTSRGTDGESEKLKEACQDFEAIFIKQMLDSMRKTINRNGLIQRNMGEDIFEDMLYDEYAKRMAKSGDFGIAELMYKQLSGLRYSQNNTLK